MDVLEERADGILIRVRLQPKSSREEILQAIDGRLRIRVSSPPVEGAANAAAIRLLSKTLRVAKSNVTLVRGERSREKDFLVKGVDAATVREALKISLDEEGNHD